MPDPINECYRRIRLKEKLNLAHQLLIIGTTYTIAMTRHIVFIVALILLSGCNIISSRPFQHPHPCAP
jgi:hypothetical protein